ncbi:hypothetical protein [Actinomadura meridiana]
MICQSCRERRHEECRGGSWCDCQHQRGPATRDERSPESGVSADGETGTGGDAEPPVNWRRQG